MENKLTLDEVMTLIVSDLSADTKEPRTARGPVDPGTGTVAPKINSVEDFIKKAEKVHGKKFDYSRVEYVNEKALVTIICPEHGAFQQAAFRHVMGAGCPKCARLSGGGVDIDTNAIIEAHRKAYGDKFNYAVVAYPKGTTVMGVMDHPDGKRTLRRVRYLKKF